MTPKSTRTPAVNETRGHRLTLTILRCEILSLESPAFGLGVLRAGRTGDAGAGCLRRELLLCRAFDAIAINHALSQSEPTLSRLASRPSPCGANARLCEPEMAASSRKT
jgi:hypothetical protein